MMNKIIYALPVLTLMVMAVLSYRTNNPAVTDIMTSWPIPAFKTQRLWNDELTFTDKDLPNSPHILHIFSSWCETCQQEHENIMALSNQYNIPIYGVAYKDVAPAIKLFLHTNRNPYKAVGLDYEGKALQNPYFTTVPTLFIIDGNKQVRYTHNGALTQRDIQKIILPIMDKLKKQP